MAREMHWSSKSLLIFDDQVFYRDETCFGSNESHALFLIKAGQRFGKVSFLARVAPCPQSVHYPIPPNVNVCPLPFYENVATLCARFLHFAPGIAHLIRNGLQEWDVLWLAWPHPVSLLVLILLRIYGKGQAVCLFVRGDNDRIVKHRYAGLRKLVALSVGAFMEGQLRLWNRRSIVFAVGDELAAKYGKVGNIVRSITCSPLQKCELAPLEPMAPFCRQEALRLLYVGRLEPEKGLMYLLQAVASLHHARVPVLLSVVGEGSLERELRAFANSQKLDSVVTFHGYCPLGGKLVKHYRYAHLFVLPSLTEGVPKVIIEALAFGTPVIATRVGSIPSIIQHRKNGWLVDAGSAKALNDAIREAASATALREAVRQEGWRDVEPLLFEVQEEIIYQSLEELFSGLREAPDSSGKHPLS